MADMIKFFKGLEASLPASGVNGALYITTDEGAIYLGTGTGMKRLGDFVQVDAVANLPAKAHEGCLYYCVAENILAKWNGTEWKQINKQPTAEEMKTLLGLGTLAYKSEVAEADLNADLAAKINASADANHTHANADELAKVADGDVEKWNTAYTHSQAEHAPVGAQANVIETVKVNGTALTVTDKAVDITVPIGALAGKDKVAKADLDEALATEIDNKVAKETGKSLVADTEITRLAGVSEGANKVEASTNGKIKIDGVETTVYTHPDKHAIADVDGLQDALDTKLNANGWTNEGFGGPADKTLAALDEKTGTGISMSPDGFMAMGEIRENDELLDVAMAVLSAQGGKPGLVLTQVDRGTAAGLSLDGLVHKADKDAEEITYSFPTQAGTLAVVEDLVDFETKENVKKVADDLADYKTSNDKALADHATEAGNTYETKTDAAQKLVDAKAYTDEKIAAIPAQTDYSVTITENTDDNTVAKTYVFSQCGAEIGSIKLAKELVVTAGSVKEVETVDVPYAGAKIGDKYIELVIANQDAPIYVPAKDLVDIYTAKDGATEVQVAISNTNEISATLVNGGVTEEKLAEGVKTKLNKTWEEVGVAANLDAALHTTISNEIDADVKAAKDALLGTTDDTADVDTILGAKAFAKAEAEGVKNYADGKFIQEVTGANAINVATTDHKAKVTLKLADGENAGNVVIEQSANGLKASVDLSSYATESYVDGEIADALTGYATESYVDDEIADALTGYATEAYVDGELEDYALADNVYKKTETYTRDEVDAAIADAVEAAHTWGSF